MNALMKPIEQSVTERAANALSKAETETQIKALVQESKPIVAVIDSASREICHGSLMTLKNMRVLIQNRGKEGREEAVKYSKAVIQIEKELVALITPEETRLAVLRDEWDSIKAREKEAAIQAEIKRVADIQSRIEALRGCQVLNPASGSVLIAEHIADAQKIVVDESFDEFQQQAADAKIATIYRLTAMFNAAVAHEAEQAKIIAERAELSKLRAEQADRDRMAAAAQAKADADAKIERERIASENAEKNRIERERIAKDEADAKAIRDAEKAENDRKAAERQAELDTQAEAQRVANAAETKRLADQQAEIDRQQEAIRVANLPKLEPLTFPAAKPTREDILKVLAAHYQVSAEIMQNWLSAMRWTKAKAS